MEAAYFRASRTKIGTPLIKFIFLESNQFKKKKKRKYRIGILKDCLDTLVYNTPKILSKFCLNFTLIYPKVPNFSHNFLKPYLKFS